MPRFSDLLGGDDPRDDATGGDSTPAPAEDATRELPAADQSDHLDRLAEMAAARPGGDAPGDSGEVVMADVASDDPTGEHGGTAGTGRPGLDDLPPVDDDILPRKKGRR